MVHHDMPASYFRSCYVTMYSKLMVNRLKCNALFGIMLWSEEEGPYRRGMPEMKQFIACCFCLYSRPIFVTGVSN